LKQLMSFFTQSLLIIFFVGACGGTRPHPAPGPATLEQIHITATRDGEHFSLDSYDAETLFNRAAQSLRKGDCEQANKYYSKLITEYKDSDLVEPALYNAGVCFDQREMYRQAVTAYKMIINKFPESDDIKDALFRLAGSYEKLEAWEEATKTFDTLLFERDDLKGVERVEALARKGTAQVSLGLYDEAELVLGEAVRLQRNGRNITLTDSVYHYSMAQFKLGEILHNKMRAVMLSSDESLLKQTLEKKAQLLLDAQRLYTKVIRIGHPHWSGASAYRIGSLYHHLWVDILAAPPPADLTDEEREIYTDILKKRIKVLLRKAIVQWERTIKFADRLDLEDSWLSSAVTDLNEIRNALAMEEKHEEKIKKEYELIPEDGS